MASPIDQTSSKNSEKVQQVEEPSQTKLTPNLPRTPVKKRIIGFDCEFVEQPPKAFQVDCPVCLLVLHEPHQLTCCGYSYCQPCVDRVEKDKKPCPTCNKTEFSVFPNKGLQRSLYGFCVRCSHEKEGCQWTDELGELEKHLNENPNQGQWFIGCEFTEIECSECSKAFQRQHFKAHQLEQHPFNCEYCHDYESYFEDVVENHYPICGFRPVPCPNECGVHPERQNIEHHVSKECPLTLVDCDFNYTGCDMRLLRKDLPAHLAENLVPHMAQLATYNQKKVQEKDQQIMQLTEELKEKLEENGNKISQLEKENEALSKSLLEKKEEIAQLHEQLCVKDKATEETFTQLKEHVAKEEQEIAQLSQKSREENKTLKRAIAQLRRDKQRQDATIKQEIAKLRRMQKDAVSWEENEALEEKVTHLQEDVHELLEEKVTHLQEVHEALEEKVTHLQEEVHEALEEKVTHLQEEVHEALEEKVTHLQEEVHMKIQNEDANKAMRKEIVQMKVELDQVQSYHATARCVELTMREFRRHWQNGDEWYSNPFYTHPHGYKMCLRVDAKGWGNGRDTHVSVFVHMMQGEYDDHLEWPFRGEVTVQLLQGKKNCSFTVCFNPFANSATFICGQQVTTSERAVDGMGRSKFIHHNAVDQFRQDDCLRFQVTRASNMRIIPVCALGPTVLSSRSQLTVTYATVPPFGFIMTDFEQEKVKNRSWFSPSFYTHPQGYKMCLRVDANGEGNGEGTHVSAFIYLMRGEHDSFLAWPFRGDITIQLLNQIEDKEHHERTIHYTKDTNIECASRVITAERAMRGWGQCQFIPHCNLNYDQTRNCQYLKYDSLSFRISSVK